MTFRVKEHKEITPKLRTFFRDKAKLKLPGQTVRNSENRFQIFSKLPSDYVYAFRVETVGILVNQWTSNREKEPHFTSFCLRTEMLF